MKAVIVNSVLKEGSTGKIAYGLYQHLKTNGHECLVCYGRGKIYPNEPDLIRLSSRFAIYLHAALARVTGLQGFFSHSATRKFVSILKRFQPDVVFLQNLHGYYLHEFKTFSALKQLKLKTLYLMADEYSFLGKCCYHNDCTRYQTGCGHCPDINGYPKSLFLDMSHFIWNQKKKAYQDFESILYVSAPYVVSKASQSELLRNKKFYALDTGVNLEFYSPRNTDILREKHKLQNGAKVALCVARFSDTRKGAQYFLEAACLPQCKDIIFIHVGFYVADVSYPKNYIPISYMNDQDELAAYYSLADILVCPSLADAMPNVCLEALGCGTPVCGFDCGGTPYTASPEFGTFVPKGDVKTLAQVIFDSPLKTQQRIADCRQYALSRFSWEMLFSKLENRTINFIDEAAK